MANQFDPPRLVPPCLRQPADNRSRDRRSVAIQEAPLIRVTASLPDSAPRTARSDRPHRANLSYYRGRDHRSVAIREALLVEENAYSGLAG